MNANEREWIRVCVRSKLLLRRRRYWLATTGLLLWLTGGFLASRLFAYQSATPETPETKVQVLFQGVGDTQSLRTARETCTRRNSCSRTACTADWFGGQGRDGHDRIHLAELPDGQTWTQKGVVLDRGQDNHVNDPSVVHVGGVYFLYYTRAHVDISDVIDVATSDDGIHWTKRGTALDPGKEGQWNSLLVRQALRDLRRGRVQDVV